jgi:hypothetical protein
VNGEGPSGRELQWWKVALLAAPVGIAVATFVSVRWQWGVLILVGLLLYVGVLYRLHALTTRRALNATLLAFACIFLALIAILGAYADVALPQPWFAPPVAIGVGVVAVVLGVASIRIGSARPKG